MEFLIPVRDSTYYNFIIGFPNFVYSTFHWNDPPSMHENFAANIAQVLILVILKLALYWDARRNYSNLTQWHANSNPSYRIAIWIIDVKLEIDQSAFV